MKGPDAHTIRTLFDRLAPYYDNMNDMLSLGMHRRWRSAAVRMLQLQPTDHVLDLCCGTCAWTADLARAVPRGRVVGMDMSEGMLAGGVRKLQQAGLADRVEIVQQDVHHIPFPDNTFAAVTIGFGLRNVLDPGQVLQEMERVVRPGGRIAVLELHGGKGRALGWQWFSSLSGRLLPTLGRQLVNQQEAYTWLRDSMQAFPTPAAFARFVGQATKLQDITSRCWLGGMVALTVAMKR